VNDGAEASVRIVGPKSNFSLPRGELPRMSLLALLDLV
jgi:hypothetical protein